MARMHKRYDHRLKILVIMTHDIPRFVKLGIPRSTLKEWIKKGVHDVVTPPELELAAQKLVSKNLILKHRIDTLTARQDLVAKTLVIFGFQIQFKRLPSETAKAEILSAIKSAVSVISLAVCLEVIGLSAARYHAWLKRQVKCLLQDQNSCPRVSPTRLTPIEIDKIKQLATNNDFAHYSVTSLSWLAKKTGEVMASPSTWSRIIRQYKLSRTRARIYPARPKIGIRASKPGQIWHLDLTILRLKDGTKAYVQCNIDNFFRYVLAWKVSPNYGGVQTKALLLQAICKAQELGLNLTLDVFVDSGVENLNEHVDELVSSETIDRTVAQIDVDFSNSMIEMLFHRLNFSLADSNRSIPHSALKGATPEEVVTGNWTEEKIAELKLKLEEARNERIATNRLLKCTPCLT